MATLMERLAFLQKVPILMKATADDETPCPGYIFEEIGKISHESVGWCQCLLEYLLDRLQVPSCHVKLKVLKILLHLCGQGSPHFLTELRRNATFIQEVTVHSGPPDPIHGTGLYQRVRAAAQDLACQLFTDTLLPQPALAPNTTATPALGMGSESVIRSGMQGFGYSPKKATSGGASLLGRIQRAAEVVASAVLPPAEQQGLRLHDNHYRAVLAPPAAVEVAVPACSYPLPPPTLSAARRSPGQAGGGWEESDSGNGSHDSSQNGLASRASASDSQSGASRESADLLDRVDAMHLGDCCQETMLISGLTDGSKVFLSREEVQRFIKECSILNCEVVVELLCRKLQEPTHTVQMRALSAIACLMSSDLLSLDHMFGVTHKHLGRLSKGPPGPAANKATKLLRQFQALIGGQVGVAQGGVADSALRLPEGGAATSSAQPRPPSGCETGQGPVASETPDCYHSKEEGREWAESSADCHAHMDTRQPSLFSGMELLMPKPAKATPTLTDSGATPTLTDSGATPTLMDSGATPTLMDRGATPTLMDSGATPTLTDSGATPTLMERGATPTLMDSVATPTLTDNGATPTLTDSGATPTLTDSGATPTLTDSGATPTLTESGATPTLMDSGATPTLMDSGATPTLTDIGATPTLMERGATPTLMDSGATPTLMERGATPTLMDSGATPTLTDIGATPTLMKRGATPTLMDSGATPTLMDSGATPTLTDRGAVPTLMDSGATPTLTDRGAVPTLMATPPPRETCLPQAPPPSDPPLSQQRSAFSFLNA